MTRRPKSPTLSRTTSRPVAARRGGHRGKGVYHRRHDRREILQAIGVVLAIVLVTASSIWLLRPNQDSANSDDSGSDPIEQLATTTTTTLPPSDSTTTSSP